MKGHVASPPLRVGIAGTGMIGSIHGRSARLAGARLAAVAASTPERSERAAAAMGAERAMSAEELATAPDIDVVHVCTPNHLHAELAMLALEHDKHVVLEKPIAMSLDEAAAIEAAARKAERTVAVPFVYRYHPVVRHARELVRRGDLGDVQLIHGSYLQDWLLSPAATNWRVDPDLGGTSRAFADIGSHWCDLAAFVGGCRFTELTSTITTAVPARDDAPVLTEDVAMVILRADGGTLANVVVSQVSPGRKNRLWLEVDGTLGSAAFDQEDPERLWLGREAESSLVVRDPGHLAPAAARLAVAPPGHPQGYLDCFDAFVADVYAGARDGTLEEGTPTVADGLRAVAVTEAVLRSAGTGAWEPIAATDAVTLGAAA
jgi:predicted dehydrogenase